MKCKVCKHEIYDDTYALAMTSGDVIHNECLEDYFMDNYFDEFYQEWLDNDVIHKANKVEV